MKISYTLSFEDLFEQQLFNHLKLGHVRKHLRNAKLIYGGYLVIFLILNAFYIIRGEFDWFLILILVALLAMFLAIKPYKKRLFENSAKKHIAKNLLSIIDISIEINFKKEDIYIEDKFSKVDLDYNLLQKVYLLKKHVYISCEGATSIFIPNSAIPDLPSFKAIFIEKGIVVEDWTHYSWKNQFRLFGKTPNS